LEKKPDQTVRIYQDSLKELRHIRAELNEPMIKILERLIKQEYARVMKAQQKRGTPAPKKGSNT
jgi:hypothetical protein